MITEKIEWSERDQILIHRLSTGMSKSAAAREVGLTRERVSEIWNSNLEFRMAVREVAKERLDRDERLLSSTLLAAVKRLQELVQSEDESVALRAIAIVINRTSQICDANIRNDLDQLTTWRQESAAAATPSRD